MSFFSCFLNTCMTNPYYRELTSVDEVRELVAGVCAVEGGRISAVRDIEKLNSDIIHTLQFNASVSVHDDVKKTSIDWINEIALQRNLTTGSNADFYDAKARGEHEFFTVPAINCRMLTFHMVRAAVRAADRLALPHVVFELALSEMAYTAQQKDEYVALVKAAYVSLGLSDRVLYMQADHYQLDPDNYAKDADAEMNRMKERIAKAIDAGVYNIDIDASKFETADPAKSDRENQAENARLTAGLFHFIRQYEKDHQLPCVVSIGGEVGEVGGENTKYSAVNAYLDMIKEHAEALGSGDVKGISKVSINVGSAHGGVLGPDGKPLDTVPLDFTAHHDVYMKGVDPLNSGKHVISVQHGASTLPKQYFPLFPAMHVGEIHLATGFQNIVWDILEKEDRPLFEKMKAIAFEKFADKIAKHPTEAIGFQKENKRVTEFVKKDLLLSTAVEQIEKNLEQEFATIFTSLFTLLRPKSGHIVQGDRAD